MLNQIRAKELKPEKIDIEVTDKKSVTNVNSVGTFILNGF